MTEEYEGVTDEQFIEQLADYLSQHHLEQILVLLPNSTYIQSLESSDMHDFFMKRPDTFVPLLKRAIINIIIENNAGFSHDNIEKEYSNLKINLSSESRQTLSNIKSESVNSPVIFNCVITGLNPREVYIERASYRCQKGCAEGEMNASCNSKRELPFMACPRCGEQLIVVSDRSIYKYFQRAVLQEPPEESKKGNPLESDAVLTDTQVGDATVGDRKQIIGILRPLVDKKSLANNQHKIIIDVKSIDDLEGKQELLPTPEEIEKYKLASQSSDFLTKLAKSFAPEIFADDLLLDVKKTMLLCLAGGVKTDRKRGDINILLLGDPSMAKSTLLKFANTIIKKSMYASGRGTSAAGLTIGIVKRHDGTAIAQAGVLPLCNDGFAFIDELDKMNPNDRSGLHETMEQQSCSIAKAGIAMTLPARTAIIAAANPKGGKWNDGIQVVDNINLMPTLLSRFDLKWCIRDIVARGTDELKASHILNEYSNETVSEFSPIDLQKFLNHIRKARPVLSPEAKEQLRKFYVKIRQKSIAEEQAIIDTRQIESLIRMAFAHAKIYFKPIVTMEDIDVITSLYESSLASFGFDLQSGDVHMKTFEQGDRDNQIELWWKVWNNVKNKDTNHVDYKQFMDELSEYDKVWTEPKIERFWNKLHMDGKIIMKKDGWLKV